MPYRFLSFLFLPFLFLFQGCDRKIEPPRDHQAILRISSEGDPQTLDPRQARDLASTTYLHLLYEGLTRAGINGQPIPAIAETISFDPDEQTYTFKLRSAAWSDGHPITAQDFEQTWKSTLDPDFSSPNAYQLYAIKGAQAAKEGKGSLEAVGVKALDEHTLQVALEQPTPHFLQLTSTHFFFPVHQSLRHQKNISSDILISNGPFILAEWAKNNQLSVASNPVYWDRSSVKLDKIVFIILDNPTALNLFHANELEWTGSPLSTIPTDALSFLKETHQLQISPAAGIYLFRINTEKAPLNNVKMRQAFSLALNRHDLVEHVLQGNQEPAMRYIPPSFLENSSQFTDGNIIKARQLFEEALAEDQLTAQDFPFVSVCYATGERAHKIAQVAQQQWKNVLGVNVDLQSCESKVFYDRIKNHDYQLGIGSWFADFRDPISFLDVFRLKNNGTNNTQWESAHFIELLARSSQTLDSKERNRALAKAEKILMQEMPIIPLFYSAYNYLKNPNVKGVYFSELGYLDFKNASIEE
jgi:oligopeptide transport system substrate-binding protein